MRHNLSVKKWITLSTLGILLSFACAKSAEAKPGDAYSADKAAKYADSCFKKSGSTYVINPNPKYGEELCAGYVSQCLKEGGMEMDENWYWNAIGDSSGSWRISKQLFSYMKEAGYSINYSPTDEDVKKGDVIFYYTNNGWGHVAICVGISENGKPMVNAYNKPHYHSTYWTMGYKTCVVSMESVTAAPKIKQTADESGKKITLSTDTANADIYYTTNGKNPTTSSQKYTKPFVVNKNTTVKAYAVYPSYKDSEVVSCDIDMQKVLENGIYYLKPSGSDTLALGAAFSSKQENLPLSLLSSNAEYNRKFKLTYQGNGNYTMTLLHSGMGLAEKLYTSKTIGSIVQEKSSSSQLQQWTVSVADNGTYRIQNTKTNHYLSIGNRIEADVFGYTNKKKEDIGQTWSMKATSASNLKLEGYTAPIALKKGKKFVLSGTLSSNYSIKSIKITITDASGKTEATTTVSPNAKKYSLTSIKNPISFASLEEGTHTITITAYDTTKCVKNLVKQNFRVDS